MSLFGAITDALYGSSNRSIDDIIPDVVFEESHRDELIITQHPVEKGAAITDHAFKRPAEVEMRCGWSDSTAGYEYYSRQVYDRLRALQASRRLFVVYTGKRRYRNMLIRGLALTTDPKSEYAAIVIVALQEVVLTSTQSTGGQQQPSTATPGSNDKQADPASTGDVQNRGEVPTNSVGSQAFLGSYNPGDYSAGGGGFNTISPGNGDLGLGGAVGEALDGLSQPTVTGDIGEITVQDGTTGEILQQGEAPAGPPINVFGAGNPGF
jgi:hypothetical protein